MAPNMDIQLRTLLTGFGGRGLTFWEESGRVLYSEAFVKEVEAFRAKLQ